MRIVVCGAGVIGAAIAYYLARRGARPLVIERVEPAAAASGKAGGFLALDWCDDSPLGPLARASFALHAELAATFATGYGYRAVSTLMIAAGSLARGVRPGHSGWLDGAATEHARLGDATTTAQVHPRLFTRALLDSALTNGATLERGTVAGIDTGGAGGAVRGVLVDGRRIPADAVIIAMGPWSARACAGLALPAIAGALGHSIVLRPRTAVPAECLFVEFGFDDGARLSPEIYPRPDGDVYACGLPGDAPLPDDPGAIESRPEAARALHAICAGISSVLADAAIVASQACYRPIAADALPLIGPVAGTPGAYVATGHNCWGILNAPATGLAMAELVLDGAARCLDLKPFRPGRAALAGTGVDR